jgi:hypothetical protein
VEGALRRRCPAWAHTSGSRRHCLSSQEPPVAKFSSHDPCVVFAYRCLAPVTLFASPNRRSERRRRRANRLSHAVEVSSPRPLSPSPSYLPLDAPSRPGLFFQHDSNSLRGRWSLVTSPMPMDSVVPAADSPPASAQPSSFARDWTPCRRGPQRAASPVPGVQAPRALALSLCAAALPLSSLSPNVDVAAMPMSQPRPCASQPSRCALAAAQLAPVPPVAGALRVRPNPAQNSDSPHAQHPAMASYGDRTAEPTPPMSL